MTGSPSVEGLRAQAWDLGIQHREALVKQFLAMHRLSKRPLLKDTIDRIIEDVQEARLLEGVLPLDTFGQTERVQGRTEVTINKRISEMPGIKDSAGVAYVTKWHESVHISDMKAGRVAGEQLRLGLTEESPAELIVCKRRAKEAPFDRGEFVAENAALAAAVCGSDLRRCQSFQEFHQLAARGGDITIPGWTLLYTTAEFIGVNISALAGYLQQRGVFRIESHEGRPRLIAAPQLLGETLWPDGA